MVAETDSVKEAKWLSGMLEELGLTQAMQDKPLIYGDNTAASALTERSGKSERTKHMDVRVMYVLDEFAKGNVKLLRIESAKQPADLLTKPLDRGTFEKHRQQLMGQCAAVQADTGSVKSGRRN